MDFKVPQLNVIQVLREIPTEGNTPLEVIAEDGKVYYAKSGKGQNPPISILNEYICTFLLRIWEIHTPAIATLELDPGIIDFHLSVRNRKSHYRTPCFGSALVPEAVEVTRLSDLGGTNLKLLANPLELIWIALFDNWVGNEDRKPSNLNLLQVEDRDSGKIRIFAIDHGQAFLFMRYADLPEEVPHALSMGDSILDSNSGKEIAYRIGKRKWKEIIEGFPRKVQTCEKMFSNLSSFLPESLSLDIIEEKALRRFLFDSERNEKVLQEFLTRYTRK